MSNYRVRIETLMDPIKAELLVKRERPSYSQEGALSSGSTLLNLACTENPKWAFLVGGYYLLVGDSMSGKTWLSLSCFAEACANPAFKNYRLIFDDVEGGAKMDIAYYFGKEVARRIEPPRRKGKVSLFSDTVESFYYHISEAIEQGEPFIYVLDSQDALVSDSSSKKFAEKRKAHEDGEKTAGSYGDGKAKFHSENLRHVLSGLRRTKSILLIIGQTRDNLGFGFDPKTRSGGKALRFYANLEIWSSVKNKIKKLVRGQKRTIGSRCIVEVKKNRVTGKVGKDRSIELPIYYGLGIDDVGSCVDYLITEQHWEPVPGTGKKKIYDANDILFQGSRDKLIAYIEEEGLEAKVRKLTASVWEAVEEECMPKRKKRYE